MLQRFPQLTLIGIDRDPNALDLAGRRLAPFGNRARLVHAVYDEIADVVEALTESNDAKRERRRQRRQTRPHGRAR